MTLVCDELTETETVDIELTDIELAALLEPHTDREHSMGNVSAEKVLY